MHQIERVAPVAQGALILLFSAVVLATSSAILHSHIHTLSHVLLYLAMIVGFLAFLKIANHVLSESRIAKFIHWLHAMCFEVITFFAMLSLRFLPRFFKTKTSPGKPILLVHGYCHHGSAWTYIHSQLGQKVGPLYTIDLGHPFRSLHDYAAKVKEFAAQIRQETNHADLILVGHSMGGIVGALVALQEPQTVASVITIGSPLSGTNIAKIGLGTNARQMERNSKLIAELKERLKQPTSTRFYHVGTKTDQIVIPGHSSVPGNCPENEFLFEDLGHASLLFSPRVANLLLNWLTIPNDSEGLRCKEGSKSL